jgi:predicted aspartyl protease
MRIAVNIMGSNKEITALVDTGASKSIVSTAIIKNLTSQIKPSSTNFEIVNGSVKSLGTFEIRFNLPTLKRKAIITHQFELIKKSSDEMIIGRDLLSTLGIVINFKDKTIEWDGNVVAFNPNKYIPTKTSSDEKKLKRLYYSYLQNFIIYTLKDWENSNYLTTSYQ